MADGEQTGSDPAPVPYHRFKEVNDELRVLKARVAELEPKAGEADGLRRKLEETRDSGKAQLAAMGVHLSMADAGLTDPLGREVAQLVYNKLPEEGRPPLVDWFRGLGAEGVDVPAPLREYVKPKAKAAETSATATAIDVAQKLGIVQPTGSTGKQPPAGAGATAQAIREAEATFKRTGDQAAYAARLRELKVIT